MKLRILHLTIVTLSLLIAGCKTATESQSRNRFEENGFPGKVLWVWERPEDLEFLDSNQFAVAFLAQTLVLKNDEVVFKPRRHPFKVHPETRLIAVTRIESQKTGSRASLTSTQKEKLVDFILKTRELKNVSAIQIDFDATTSERKFYSSLLHDLRKRLPDNVPLSMTALASFCIGDRWLNDLPVDDAVPMIFRMGADNATIKSFLARGNDFREPLCRKSFGIALDEPVETSFGDSRRKYVFNVHSWTEKDVLALE
jgi:hypothetical protein